MALWKPFRGSRSTLDTVAKHDGYVYFCIDDGSLFFDYTDADGALQRKQISAKEAEALIGYDIATILNSSDIEIPTSKAVLDALARYQTKTDEGLETESKEVVGAINEVNGKTVDKIATIHTYEVRAENFDTDGSISWKDGFGFYDEDGKLIKQGEIHQKIPICAGENISFSYDEDNNAIAINAPESMIGEWVFNDKITSPPEPIEISFTSNDTKYVRIYDDGDGIYYDDEAGEGWSVYYYIGRWEDETLKTINILEEPSAEAATWIKANGKRKEPIGVDKVKSIDTWVVGVSELGTDDGIYWKDGFDFYDGYHFEGGAITGGQITHRVPIVAGENITFEITEGGDYVKINATGGGSSTESMIGTWVFNEVLNASNLPLEEGDVELSVSGICYLSEKDDLNFTFLYFSGYTDNIKEFGVGNDETRQSLYYGDGNWDTVAGERKIDILKEPPADAATWIKANAVKQSIEYQPKEDASLETTDKTIVGAINEVNGKTVDKINHFDFASGDNYDVSADKTGIHWENDETEIEMSDYSYLYNAFSKHNVPIVAGDNVTFEVDNTNNVVKISVPAIGDIQTALDSIIAQTNSIIGGTE